MLSVVAVAGTILTKRVFTNLRRTTCIVTPVSVAFNNTCDLFVSKFHAMRPMPYEANKLSFDYVKKLKDSVGLFEDMLRKQHMPVVSNFSKLLKDVVKMQHYDVALSLFNRMRGSNAPLDCSIMNISIHSACCLDQVDLGFGILGIIFKSGIEPDVTTFNTLIKGLVLENRSKEAELLFKHLFGENKSDWDRTSFLIVLIGLCRAGDSLAALNFLGLLETENQKVNTIAYNTVIDAMCKRGNVDDALLLFSTMAEKHVLPNVVTYTALIQGLCSFDRLEEAKQFLDEMVAPSDAYSFNILVSAFCKKGRMNEAENVFNIMTEKHGISPNIFTYVTLMTGYRNEGESHLVDRVFRAYEFYILTQGQEFLVHHLYRSATYNTFSYKRGE